MKIISYLKIGVLALASIGLGRAHDVGLSTAEALIRDNTVELTNGFAPADIEQLLPESERGATKWSPSDFDAMKAHLLALAPELWEIRSGTTVLRPEEIRVELLPGDNVSFDFSYPLPLSTTEITLRSTRLGELPSAHRQFLDVTDSAGWTIGSKFLRAHDSELQVSLSAVSRVAESPSTAPTFLGFLKLGVQHIWTGYDHLLFLLALLVVCRTFRSIVVIISCFTLAHSLTLALATLNLVNLPPRLVEAAIAASILFVGLENLWRRGEEPRGRWALTFGFGLIHGFGFASVLRDLGVGTSGQRLALPLFSFNLGVELGQIVIAAVVLPLVWRLKKNEAYSRRGIPLLSAVVSFAGLYWLVERTVLD